MKGEIETDDDDGGRRERVGERTEERLTGVKWEIETDDDDGGERESRREDRREAHRGERGDRDRRR